MKTNRQAQSFFGVSLKMYFDHVQTLRWCEEIAEIASRHHAVTSGAAEIVVLPGFASLSEAARIFEGSRVQLGAQDVFWQDSGAFTGEVSGPQLSQVGCRFVEIGHAERRRLFGEGSAVLQRKVVAAMRNGLKPIVCTGESEQVDVDAASHACIAQLSDMLAPVITGNAPQQVVVAYEPEWAIGAVKPASTEHILGVCASIGQWLGEHPMLAGSQVIYGGSAGSGLLGALSDYVDGLFLGRFAHNTVALEGILDEAMNGRGEGLAHERTNPCGGETAAATS